MKPREGSFFGADPSRRKNRRRSSRVPLCLPVRIVDSGTNVASFRKNALTVDVNLHGAKLTGNYPAQIGQRIILDIPSLGQAGWAEVIRLDKRSLAWGIVEVGVGLIKPQNIWGLENLPKDWQEAAEVSELRHLVEAQEHDLLPARREEDAASGVQSTSESRPYEIATAEPGGDFRHPPSQPQPAGSIDKARVSSNLEEEIGLQKPEVSPARTAAEAQEASEARQAAESAFNKLKAEWWPEIESSLAEAQRMAQSVASEQANEAAQTAVQQVEAKLKILMDQHLEEAARQLKEMRIHSTEEIRTEVARTLETATAVVSGEENEAASAAYRQAEEKLTLLVDRHLESAARQLEEMILRAAEGIRSVVDQAVETVKSAAGDQASEAVQAVCLRAEAKLKPLVDEHTEDAARQLEEMKLRAVEEIRDMAGRVTETAAAATAEQEGRATIIASQQVEDRLKPLVDQHVEDAARRLEELKLHTAEGIRVLIDQVVETTTASARDHLRESSEQRLVAFRAKLTEMVEVLARELTSQLTNVFESQARSLVEVWKRISSSSAKSGPPPNASGKPRT